MTPAELRDLAREIGELTDDIRQRQARALGYISERDAAYMDGVNDSAFLLVCIANGIERKAA